MSWILCKRSSECLARLKSMDKIGRKHNKSTKFMQIQWATSHSTMSPKWESVNNDSPPFSSQLRRPKRKRKFCCSERVLPYLWIKFVCFFQITTAFWARECRRARIWTMCVDGNWRRNKVASGIGNLPQFLQHPNLADIKPNVNSVSCFSSIRFVVKNAVIEEIFA